MLFALRSLCCLLVVGSSLCWSQVPAVVRLCVGNADFTPYLNLQGEGLFATLLDAASAPAGIEFQFVSLPWKRCLSAVGAGKVDAMVAVGWSQARDRQFAFPLTANRQVDPRRRIWSGVYSVFVRPKTQLAWDGQRFESVKYGIATPLGYLSRHRLRALGVLAMANLSLAQGLTLVSHGRLDGFVVEQHIGRRRALQLALDLEELKPPFMVFPWYLVFSKRYARTYPARVDAVWQALGLAREGLQPLLVHRHGLAPEIDY